jgi:sec-independent protein translocase protein TatA
MTPYVAMFSAWDITLILVVVLLLFGGKKLPELAKSLGQSLNEFKKGKGEADKPEEKKDDENKPSTPKVT